MLKKFLMLAALSMPACYVDAHEYAKGHLVIDHPWSLELPPNAPTVAAYFVIQNKGSEADRLLSAGSPVAGTAQLHEHVSKDGLMKMQQVQAVDVPAGGQVKFAPMAYHVMLLDVKDRSKLTDGQSFALTLHFEKTGDVTVDVKVQRQAPQDAGPSHAH